MFELPDENIKSVRIPLSDINSIQQDGKILLRYRIVSKDKNKQSHWSKIHSIDPLVSFSELNGKTKPFLSYASNNTSYTNSPGYGNVYTSSSISRTQVATDSFLFTWSVLNNESNLKNFDVYTQFSWWNGTETWSPAQYAGTTPTNSFGIERPAPIFNIPNQTAIWDGVFTTITFETSTPHGLVEGQQVFIDQVNPSTYNGIYNVYTGTSGTTVVIYRASNPGITISAPGILKPIYRLARAIVTESAFPKITDMSKAENIVLSISDNNKPLSSGNVITPFSIWESPVGTIAANTFTIPVQTTTVTGTTNNWDVIITISGSHNFLVGQQVEITGVTPTTYNGTTRTIQGIDGNRIRFLFTTATAPSTSITGSGTMICRNLFTISNLASSFTEAPTKPKPIEISLTGLLTYAGGDYDGKVEVIGKSGTSITISTDTAAKPDASNSVGNIKL